MAKTKKDEPPDMDSSSLPHFDCRLSKYFQLLMEAHDDAPEVTITYFQPDERKAGGKYVSAVGAVKKIATFNERVVREAILNAVSHRNYQFGGSIFVRQFRDRLVVESPGGLPFGITLDNILDRQLPRNRRIAEILSLCGICSIASSSTTAA